MRSDNEPCSHSRVMDAIEVGVHSLILPVSSHEALIDLVQHVADASSSHKLAEIARAEPSVACAILSAYAKHNLSAASSLSMAIESLGPALCLSHAIQSPLIDDADPLGCEFSRHCQAVAQAGARIALFTGCLTEEQGYLCGLLHDIGKRAMRQAMPKAYLRMVTAQSPGQQNLSSVEQEAFGLDHCILGRRLAKKWNLSVEIEQAIWLHHQSVETSTVPGLVTALADACAIKAGMGWSGSLPTQDINDLANALSLHPSQIDEVIRTICVLPLLSPDAQRAAQPRSTLEALGDLNAFLADQLKSAQEGSAVEGLIEQLYAPTGSVSEAIRNIACVIGHLKGYPSATYLISQQRDKLNIGLCRDANACKFIDIDVVGEIDTTVSGSALESLERLIDISDLGPHVDLAIMRHLPFFTNGSCVGGVLFHGGDSPVGMCSIGSIEVHVRNALAGLAHRQASYAMEEKLSIGAGLLVSRQESIASARAISAIAEMAAGAAHEINNPLAVISGRAQLMLRQRTDAEQRRVWELIVDQAHVISDMISELMEFAAPAVPEPRLIMVAELFKIVVDTARTGIENGKIVNCAQDVPQEVDIEVADSELAVFVDQRQAQDVLLELLRNAIAAGAKCIRLEARQQDAQVLLRVEDDGDGMSSQTMAKAFTPFFSQQKAGRRRGMGLAWARRYVELNAGRISIQSVAGNGTEVLIAWPAGGK